VLTLRSNSAVTWSKEMHVELGDIAHDDGSVQQMSNSRLKQSLGEGVGPSGTNLLVFPQ
jgi:hypothetical protein